MALSAYDSIPVLTEGIDRLNTDTDPDYWKPTEGNARKALETLLSFAQQSVLEKRDEAIWRVN